MLPNPTKTPSILLLSFWLLAFLGILYFGHLTQKAVQFLNSTTNFYPSEEITGHPQELSPESQRLLYGDSSKDSEDARWQALHESDPNNPFFYVIYLQHASEIPDNFHQTVTHLDPDNGWYSLWEISKLEPTFERSRKDNLNKSERDDLIREGRPLPPKKFDFTDLETFRQHLTLLETGLNSLRLDSYTREIATLRFEAQPKPVDYRSNIISIAVAASTIDPVHVWQKAAETLSAALQIAETAEDFHRLEKLCLKLEEHLHHNSSTLVSGLVYKAVVDLQAKSLRAAAERLGLEKIEAFYRDRQLRFQNEQEQQRQRREDDSLSRLMSRRSDILSALSTPLIHKTIPNPPKISVEMLKPALRSERAVASQVFYSVFFFGFSLFAFAVWLKGRKKETPASFMFESRLLFFGSLLPFIFLLVFRYFLSFGMLDFGGRLLIFWNYLTPELGIFCILLIFPWILANKQTDSERSLLKTWWPLGLAIPGLLFASAMMHLLNLGSGVFLIPGLLLGVAFLWGLRQMIRKPSPGEARHARIAPCYLLSAILCSLFVVALIAEERFWFRQDGIHHPTATGLSSFESETTELINEFVHQLRGPNRQ